MIEMLSIKELVLLVLLTMIAAVAVMIEAYTDEEGPLDPDGEHLDEH